MARRDGVRVVNQLQFVIDLLKRDRRPRESALQITCFDPAKDHTGQPVRGFPCLQQVSIAYDDDGRLAVNAFYPMQYIFDRAYGNYLGLCHLGEFLAHETQLRFSRLTCFIGKPELGEPNEHAARTAAGVVDAAGVGFGVNIISHRRLVSLGLRLLQRPKLRPMMQALAQFPIVRPRKDFQSVLAIW